MQIINGNSAIELSDGKAALISYVIKGRELCLNKNEAPLITVKLLDDKGNPYYFNSNEALKVNVENHAGKCVINFTEMNEIDCTAVIEKNSDNGFLWSLSLKNRSGMIIEWVEYPAIRLKNTLSGNGGDSKLFWPVGEGVLIENASLRENSIWKYREITRKTGGYNGFYPASATMQYMAFYNDLSGLYIGAHDTLCAPKTLEWYSEDDSIAIELRNFANGAKEDYTMEYSIVTLEFEGDWQDAAELYRSWMEENIKLPKKLYQKNDLPKWLSESPVIVLYPIRGSMDRGDMTPNMYYPYTNILKYIEEYSRKTDSKIMALLMHWEGTAPWATPYVWPPYGGEEEFKKLVLALHEKGNLIGVYCSGIGWTTKSFLDPSLDFSDKYDENLMCKTPQGEIEQSSVIGPPIREGYDMCPVSDKVADIVSGEVVSIAKSGCDYAQYFDQNLGGESSFCYARDHGHPSTPGVWQNDAMIKIFEKANADLKEIGSNMLIGCEGAAAEPFIGHLPFNDLRYEVTFFSGKPVPAYSYLFHEYLNNFMGNQNLIELTWDFDKNPESLLYRIAYSFASGDLITFPLGKDGNVHWGWDVPWDIPAPEQEPIFELTKNLNFWRKQYKEFLHTGRMVKAKPFSNVDCYTLNLVCGDKMDFDSLITARWRDSSGAEKQVIVNFLNREQKCKIKCEKVYTKENLNGQSCNGNVTVPALSAVWID